MFENKKIWQIMHTNKAYGDPYWSGIIQAQNMTDIVGPGDMYMDVQLPDRHTRFGDIPEEISSKLLGTAVNHTQSGYWEWYLDKNLTLTDPDCQLVVRRPIDDNGNLSKSLLRGINLDTLADQLDKNPWAGFGYFYDMDSRKSAPELALQFSVFYSRRGLDGNMKLFDLDTNNDLFPHKGATLTHTWFIAYKNNLDNFYTLAVNPHFINSGRTINMAEELGDHVLFPISSHRDRQFDLFFKPKVIGARAVIGEHIFLNSPKVSINIGEDSMLARIANFNLPEVSMSVESNWDFERNKNSITLTDNGKVGFVKIDIDFNDLSKHFASKGERGKLTYQYILIGE